DDGLAAVEVAHLARAHVRGADRQARRAAFDERKVDQLGERLREWRRRVEAGAVASERIVRAEKSQRIGLEESRNAAEQGRPIGRGVGEPRPVRQTPEFNQAAVNALEQNRRVSAPKLRISGQPGSDVAGAATASVLQVATG